MMVGRELPSPETRETHGHRPRPARGRRPDRRAPTPTRARSRSGLGAEHRRHRDDGRRARPARRPLDGVSIKVHAGEIVGIAGVEGNGQTELIDAIMGLRRRRAATCSLDGEDISRPGARSTRRVRGHRLHPRGPPARRHGAAVAAVGERAARPPEPARRSTSAGSSTAAPPARRATEVVAGFDVRTPGIDVPALHAVGRQPAEAHRRAGDAGRAHGAGRRPPDPRRRRRCPGGDLGHPARRPRRRAGHAARSRPTSRS